MASSINLSAPAGYSSADLVYNDNFAGTSLKGWNTFITSNAAQGYAWNSNGAGGSGPGGAYDAEYDMPSQVSVNNGLTLTAIRHNVMGVNQGGVAQKYPITSGAVSSYGMFEFTGGYLQISMAAPSGNGAWPSLWLLPGKGAGSSGDNYEIDMEEGGYTPASTAKQNMSYHLHTPSGTFGGVVNTGANLTSGYNTYGIDWEPGKSITWYLNGKEIGQITSAQAAIPTEPMEVIMSNQVADSKAAGWHTVLDGSTPQSMPMKIADVQLYQNSANGRYVLGRNVTQTASAAFSSSTIVGQQPNGSSTVSSATSSVTPPTGSSSPGPAPTTSDSGRVNHPDLVLSQGQRADPGHGDPRPDLSQLTSLMKRAETLAPAPAGSTGSPQSSTGIAAKASTLLNQLMASGPAERFHNELSLQASASQQQVATLTKPLH